MTFMLIVLICTIIVVATRAEHQRERRNAIEAERLRIEAERTYGPPPASTTPFTDAYNRFNERSARS